MQEAVLTGRCWVDGQRAGDVGIGVIYGADIIAMSTYAIYFKPCASVYGRV